MNPEIRRYAWLELTSTRVVLVPTILGLILLTLAKTQQADVIYIWLNCLCALFAVWGMGQASLSVSEEVTSSTWDWQRLSPQSAASLTLGKLIGAPIFQWYCLSLCCLAFAVTSFFGGLSGFEISQWMYRWFCGFLFCYAISLVGSIEASAAIRAIRRPANRIGRGIILFVLLCGVLPVIARTTVPSSKESWSFLADGNIHWYGIAIPIDLFLNFSLLLFSCWSVWGCYRAMRSELQFPSGPWYFLATLGMLTLYISPLFAASPSLFLYCLVLFGLSSSACYLNLLREDKDLVSYRRILTGFSTKKLELNLIPCWALSLLPMCISFVGVLLFSGEHPGTLGLTHLRIGAALVFLLILRDGCLLLSIHLRHPRHPRNDLSFIFYCLCLYYIFPACIRALGSSEIPRFFWPLRTESPAWTDLLWTIPSLGLSILLLGSASRKAFQKS